MFIRKRKLVSLICTVVSLVLLLAVPVRADNVGKNVKDNDSGFYIAAGVSLYVVDTPKYAPLWRQVDISGGAPYTAPDTHRITLKEGFVAGPLVEVTVGKELADQWFVEARFENVEIETRENTNESGNSPLNTEAIAFAPYDGSSQDLRGATDTAELQLDFAFQQYGMDLVAGKTYGGDDWQLRPFAGYWFLETHTDYRLIFAHGNSSPTHFLDKFETTYKGLMAGVEWTFPVGRWDIELETTHGAAWAQTRYHGRYITVNAPRYQSDLKLDTGKQAYRGTLQASLSTPLGKGLEFGLVSEMRYMSYVPRIISSGKAKDGSSLGDGRPAHLASDSSFSYKLGLELSCPF